MGCQTLPFRAARHLTPAGKKTTGQTLMLAATALGYQSCPMDGFDFDKVGELINLPDDHAIAFMIAIGKGTQDAWPKPGQLPYQEVVLENGFR